MPQYPTKEVNRSVKPASFDSLGALPRCGTNYSFGISISRYQSTYKMLQYPAKEADRSVKPASVDSLGALPRCSTSYSMDSSHRCESRRYFARVSELAYERHSECRAPYGLARSNRAAGTTYSIPYRWSYLSPDADSMQCVLVFKYALELTTSQLPTTQLTCIIDRRRLTR